MNQQSSLREVLIITGPISIRMKHQVRKMQLSLKVIPPTGLPSISGVLMILQASISRGMLTMLGFGSYLAAATIRLMCISIMAATE